MSNPNKHWLGFGWLLSAATLLMGCMVSRSAQNYLEPLELNKSPQSYDHKRVVVRGWLDYGFEKRFLLQSESPKESSEVNDPSCTSIEVPETLRSAAMRLNHQYVLIEGVFLSDLADERVFSGLCNKTGVQVESIKPAKVIN